MWLWTKSTVTCSLFIFQWFNGWMLNPSENQLCTAPHWAANINGRVQNRQESTPRWDCRHGTICYQPNTNFNDIPSFHSKFLSQVDSGWLDIYISDAVKWLPFPLFPLHFVLQDFFNIAACIPQQAPRRCIRTMRHIIMGPQCGRHGEFDSPWVPFLFEWLNAHHYVQRPDVCIFSLAYSNMSANCLLALLDKVLTISHAYMHHILFQPCLAALYLSRCITFSVQVSLQTNIQYSFHVPFPFTAASGESLVSQRDGWSWTGTMRQSDYQFLHCIGLQ